MKRLFTAARRIGQLVLLVAGLSSCATTTASTSPAQKERAGWYGDYINNIETGWSVNF